jgi:hypothetical protein
MKNGLYSVSLKGFDGEDWPPGGVAVLLDGVILGGGPYTHYTGSCSFKDGIFKGELVVNQHDFPPPSHVFFNAKNVGIGVSGTYEDDQAELTGIALVGNRSLTLHVTLLKLAELETSSSAPRPVVSRRAIGQLVELGLTVEGSARPPVVNRAGGYALGSSPERRSTRWKMPPRRLKNESSAGADSPRGR